MIKLIKPFKLRNILFFCFAIALFSCKKEDEIGMSIQPPSDKLNVAFTDTLTLETYCLREDSVLADETSYNLLGTINDPTFGQSNAGFVTQFSLPTANLSFDGATLDSVVLSFAYAGHYGEPQTPLSIQVYELNQNQAIYKDSAYYSNKKFDTIPVDLANNYTFAPRPNDSIVIGNTKYAPHLRIKLDSTWGKKFIDPANTSSLASTTTFREFFKGLKISASPTISGIGSVLYFDLLSKTGLSALTLYYKIDTTHYSYSFNIDATCARVNQFTHNYTAASDISNQLGNHSLGQEASYLQAMSGLKVRLNIPYLKKLSELGQISINKAELIINTDETSNGTTFPIPEKLALIGIDNNGGNTYILDQYEASSYYGGTYDATKKQYVFNIARHLQEIVSGRINNNGLTLLVSGSSIKADRLVIRGGKSSTSAMRLKLTYTKIK